MGFIDPVLSGLKCHKIGLGLDNLNFDIVDNPSQVPVSKVVNFSTACSVSNFDYYVDTCDEKVESVLKPSKFCVSSAPFKVLHLNIQSVRAKFDELEVLLAYTDCQPVIVCLNEHWLRDYELSAFVPSGYCVAASYCRSNIAHGGVAILVKSDFEHPFKSIDLSKFCSEKNFEVAAIEFRLLNVIIGTVYRTPDTCDVTFTDTLVELLLFLSKRINKTTKVFITGDININIIVDNSKTRYLLNALRSVDFYHLNEKPTRGQACIDNVLTNVRDDGISLEVIETLMSDHDGLMLSLDVGATRPINLKDNIIRFRLKNVTCINRLRLLLEQVDWLALFSKSRTVEEATENVLDTIALYLNKVCPIISKHKKVDSSPHSVKKWYTPHLKNIRLFLVILYDKSKTDPSFKDRYNRLKKVYREEMKLAKQRANENYIMNSSNKCKAAWNIINAECGRKPKLKSNDVSLSPTKLNDFFVNVSSNSNVDLESVNSILNSVRHNLNVPFDPNFCFHWKSVSSDDVSRFVKTLSNSKSEDYYGLSNYLIKELVEVLKFPIAYLFNWMCMEGVYPNSLKISVVVPIYKKGEKMSPGNYRPIALVPSFSKIFEGLIKIQLDEFFVNNNMLSPSQYGFRSGVSTCNAVQEVVNYVLTGLEEKKQTCSLFIDLSKAFDMVSHKILIEKLSFYGVQGLELSLLESYLSHRRQLVKVGNQKSDLLTIRSGVPQGSVLGPFLFTVYINDFPNFISVKSVLYADDTTLLLSNCDPARVEEMKRFALDRSEFWFQKNKLEINNNKTEEITFSLTSNNVNHKVKLLGIYLDNRLSWEPHTTQLCIKLSRVLFLLSKLRYCTSFKMTLTAYYSFFHVHLLYGALLWGNSPGARDVFLWQKKAIRCICRISNMTSCRDYFIRLKVLTMPCIYMLYSLLYVKSNLQDFKVRSQVHNYNTRRKENLDYSYVRLTKTQKSFTKMGIKLFNKLNTRAQVTPFEKFKKTIERHLKEKAYYSIEEFETEAGGIVFE